MGISIPKTQPNVQGVANTGVFTLGIPTGVKSLELAGLEMGGTTFTKSMVTNLDLLINGKPIQQFLSVADLEKITGYYGQSINSNEVVLPFRKEFMNDQPTADRFMLGLTDVATAQLRGQITGATSPTLDAFTVETTVGGSDIEEIRASNRLQLFTKIKNFTYSLTGAGTTEIDNIPKEAWAQAMHLIQSADVITGVEMWLDGVMVWDASKTRMANIVSRAGRTAQTNTYHLDWMLKNQLGNQIALAGAQDMRLKVAHSGAATVNLYVEYLSSFGGI